MPGPLSSGAARRRNLKMGWVRLPAAGREGPAPSWPLNTAVPEVSWADLWSKPQAVMWETCVRVVARYASLLERAEGEGATAALLSEVRQLEDRLGLSPVSLRRLHWEIGVESPDITPSKVSDLDTYRDLYGEESQQ